MARKKIVFVIVEGPSDDEALGVLFEKLFDQTTVFVHITHGDITSDPGVDPHFIVSNVTNIVKAYAKSNHLTNSHFQQIIHIVDTDGAFVTNDHIVEDSSAEKPIYSLTEIRTANVHGLQMRNERKKKSLSRLSRLQAIWNIPYQVYYMSCNLDHVLHNIQNLTDEEKEKKALAFVKQYRDKLGAFVQFLSESEFSVSTNYIESWEFITHELHSLERHTNLGLCVKDAFIDKTEREHSQERQES